jgi:hypothetical protein
MPKAKLGFGILETTNACSVALVGLLAHAPVRSGPLRYGATDS